ncbi:hypothetical protein, partial [Glutamicibacter sp. NPDC087673]|uniref:hypothetical protein n=1 Tax=Glutamicibacter sp. NPDC087673 TaxID=3363997 RepID=UPI003802701D
MKQKIHILLKRSISFGAALSLSAAGLMVGLSPATAQGIAPQTLRAQSLIMPAAVADTEFMAPRCEGSTLGNPETTGPDAYPNLLLVSGERLENYRDGHVVPLYDSYGYADGSYPPLCGVRYDAAADSPISEWMFCTDIGSKVCGDVLPGGQLGEVDVSVNPMEELAGNPRLDADQERLVSWLIHHESAYQGVGSYAWGGTTVASATRGTGERTALQTLIWCISDWPEASEADRLTTCEASMNQQEQQRILSLIPVAEEYLLELNPENSTVQVDDAAVLQLTTNIYGQPISLSTSSNAAIDLCEAMDGVVLAGTQLTLDAPASGDSAAIDLCVVASEATELSLNASVKPAQTVNIVWNQSQNNGEVVCQVFAGFRDASAGQISAAANITVKATVEPTEPTDPTVEPTEPTDPTDPTVEPTEPTDPTV